MRGRRWMCKPTVDEEETVSYYEEKIDTSKKRVGRAFADWLSMTGGSATNGNGAGQPYRVDVLPSHSPANFAEVVPQNVIEAEQTSIANSYKSEVGFTKMYGEKGYLPK